MAGSTILVHDEAEALLLIDSCLDEGDVVAALAIRLAAVDAWGGQEVCTDGLNGKLNSAVQARISELRVSGNTDEIERLFQLMARP